ncbi:GAF domain-containing protein [Paenibacillus sp. TAB 01]|uniref:GAF domain-containing protein n=1 Tax=Paenibacillus sp. TAB 01 TaxID=3368988 RepID=UPI00375264AC
MDMLPGIGYGIVNLLVVGALAAGWRYSHKKRREAELELNRTMQLFEVSLEMNSTIRKQDLLHKIMETTARVMNAEASSVILVDMERSELYFELAIGEKSEELQEIRLKLGEGIAGWVAETGKSVKIDDATIDPRWSSKVADTVDYSTRNMLCVPILSKGAVIGVIQVLNKRGERILRTRIFGCWNRLLRRRRYPWKMRCFTMRCKNRSTRCGRPSRPRSGWKASCGSLSKSSWACCPPVRPLATS